MIVTETVSNIGGSWVGAAGGVLLVGALVSNPAGWLVLVGAAAGGVVGGYVAKEVGGYLAEEAYDFLD